MLIVRGIDSLFQEQKSQKSLNYYMLLHGSKLNENETFTAWQIAEFVRNNDPHYTKLYKGRENKPSQIGAIVKAVKRHILLLLEIRLIKQTGSQKETKGTGIIPIYTLTPVGRLITGIVRGLELENGAAEKEILSIFEENIFKIQDISHSSTIFNSKLIKKMYEKGLMPRYVSILREATKSKRIDDIRAFAQVIQRALSIELHNPLLGIKFVDVWEETLKELEPETRDLFLYDQKIIIDGKTGSRALTREYEMLRFQNRNDVERVILEGYCIACNQRPAFPMKTTEYSRYLGVALEPSGLRLTKRCPKCEERSTLQLPNL